jgi:hypothetical protein
MNEMIAVPKELLTKMQAKLSEAGKKIEYLESLLKTR